MPLDCLPAWIIRPNGENGGSSPNCRCPGAPITGGGPYASTAELIELSREAANLGGIYHTHVRNTLGDRFLDPLKEAEVPLEDRTRLLSDNGSI